MSALFVNWETAECESAKDVISRRAAGLRDFVSSPKDFDELLDYLLKNGSHAERQRAHVVRHHLNDQMLPWLCEETLKFSKEFM